MATSTINTSIKQKTETVTFDANGYAETSLDRRYNILIGASNSDLHWESFIPFTNLASYQWKITAYKGGVSSGETRSVILYYI